MEVITMSSNELDISCLLSYQEDVAFACAAYTHLLERRIAPAELRYAIWMLKNGLSRKGFIYWICRSPEFNNRFQVKIPASSQLSCYLFKGREKLAHILKFTLHKKMSPIISSPVTGCCDSGFIGSKEYTFNFETEFSALSCGQISQFRVKLKNSLAPLTWFAVGHLAAELVDPLSIETECTPSNFTLEQCPHNFLITSPEIIFKLFTEYCISNIARLTKEAFVFTMPCLPFSESRVSIIWGTKWANAVVENNQPTSRWLIASAVQGHLTILNHDSIYKKVTISFQLESFYTDAEIIMECGNSTERFPLTNIVCPVTFDMWLNPGSNPLSFTYAGPRYVSEVSPLQAVTFAISNLHIQDTAQPSNSQSGAEVYTFNETDLGSNYYPYILPDSYIRSRLHQDGFFEVQALAISSTYASRDLGTTRYNCSNDELGRPCYYWLNKNASCEHGDSFSSVIVYIARRASALQRTSSQERGITK